MENFNEKDARYEHAKERVKRIKSFYIHATVYVLVNLFLIASNVQNGERLDNINIYWTPIVWGVGLIAHGAAVFLPGVFLGSDWEEKKIRELMDKYK